MRRAKTVATIGPASDSSETLRLLMTAGMNVARINMSHGNREQHGLSIRRIRRVSEELRHTVAVLLDLAGPKIRTGKMKGGKVSLADGDELRVRGEDILGDAACFGTNYALLAQEVRPGNRLLLSDGEIELEVLATEGSDVVARVVHGGILADHQGMNLPGARLSIPSFTEKDREDLRFGLECGVDLVALSFVRSAADCRQAREWIAKYPAKTKLIAKIEKPEALDDLKNILDEVDGVMVARGDLAVETAPELVPTFQKKIIAGAVAAQKTVITATQMLQSMIENPRPTRAEASDVANAIIDGSDALMLSAETAIGRFPVDSVRMMVRIIGSAEEALLEEDSWPHWRRGAAPFLSRGALLGRQTGSYGRALAEAAAFAAEEVGSRLIVVFTHSGQMAMCIASLRPRQRIIALTPDPQTCRQLAVNWGVEPYHLEAVLAISEEMLAAADRTLLAKGLAEQGETVVVVAGTMEDAAISNSMKLHRVVKAAS